MHAVFRQIPPPPPGYNLHTCNCNVWCKLAIGFLKEILNLHGKPGMSGDFNQSKRQFSQRKLIIKPTSKIPSLFLRFNTFGEVLVMVVVI